MLKVGDIVSKPNGSQHTVTEIGQRCEMAGGYIAPVRLGDNTYGIANVYEGNGLYPIGLWIPDTPEAAAALARSVQMPIVHRGIGSDVVHVHGKDSMGEYLIKLYYNEKKMHYQRRDELYR